MLVGRLVVLGLELDEAHEGAGRAIGGLGLRKLAGQRLGAGPIALGQLHQERLLDEDLVAGVAIQSLAVVEGGDVGVVLAARHTAGEIAAEQRFRLGGFLVGTVADGGCCRLRSRHDAERGGRNQLGKQEKTNAHVTSRREV